MNWLDISTTYLLLNLNSIQLLVSACMLDLASFSSFFFFFVQFLRYFFLVHGRWPGQIRNPHSRHLARGGPPMLFVSFHGATVTVGTVVCTVGTCTLAVTSRTSFTTLPSYVSFTVYCSRPILASTSYHNPLLHSPCSIHIPTTCFTSPLRRFCPGVTLFTYSLALWVS